MSESSYTVKEILGQMDDRINRRLDQIESKLNVNEERLRRLENQSMTSDALRKYRKWIVSGVLLLISSVVIPLVNLFLQ